MLSEFTDLSTAWRAYFVDGRVSPGLRPVILEAWRRSLAYGNRPDQPKVQTPDPARLERARDRSRKFLEHADPLIAEMGQALHDRFHSIVLLDDEGIALRLRHHPDMKSATALDGVAEGTSWLEKDRGCNAAGTALAIGKPVVFIGPEHFFPEQADWTCIGAPIRSPDGGIRGALGMGILNPVVDVDIWGWTLSMVSKLETSLAGAGENGARSREGLGGRGLDDPFHSLRGIMDFLIQEIYLTPTHEKLVGQARDRLEQAEQRLTNLLRDLGNSQEHLAAALRASEVKTAELQAVFDTIDSAVYVIEDPRRLVTANRAGLDLLGLDSMEELQDGCERILGGLIVMRDSGPQILCNDPLHTDVLRRSWATNVPARVRNMKGRDVDVLVTISSIDQPEGSPRRRVITVRDVTTLRSLERAKDEYLQVLSHELRNPLAAAFGLIQLISKRLAARADRPEAGHPEAGRDGRREVSHVSHGEDGVGRYLKTAESELRRLNDLLTDILNGYRVSSGRLPLDLMPLDLSEVLSESVAPYAGAGQERSLTFDIAGGPIHVLGDRQRLIEVMANLLSNATKYSPPGSQIKVKTVLSKHQVTVKVEDEGVGIPPDQLEKVFDGFYRATNLANRQPGGIGLGLYISRDIARRHGGDLWAENRPGKGTVMSLRLPVVPGLVEAGIELGACTTSRGSPAAGAGADTGTGTGTGEVAVAAVAATPAPGINACGSSCAQCPSLGETCSGCAVAKGRPYWSMDVLTKVCPLYRCSFMHADCPAVASCPDLPCGVCPQSQTLAPARATGAAAAGGSAEGESDDSVSRS